jgi:hypothetical protein
MLNHAAAAIVAIGTIVVVTGCSDPPPSKEVAPPAVYVPSPDGDGELTPMAGFPGPAQTLGTAYHTSVLGVTGAADGRVWVAYTDDGELDIRLDRTLTVERFDPEQRGGTVVAKVTVRPLSFGANWLRHIALCSHPSGELTVAVFTSIAGERSTAALSLTRFAADGSVLRTGYIDEPGARMVGGHAAYFVGNDLDCVSAGEDVFLAAITDGVRLYRVASDLGVRWSQLVMPMTDRLGLVAIYDTHIRVVADGNGGAATAVTLWAEDRAAFAASFGDELPPTNGDADVLVTQFSADGTRLSAGMLGGPGPELVRGFQVTGDRVRVLAEASLVKHPDASNSTLERDLILLTGDPARNLTEQAVQINLCKDDYISTALAATDGGFLVAGGACGLQLDSGSLITNRNGYVLALGPDGSRRAVTWLSGQRDTMVEALAQLPSGELALAGTRNGPLTHTDVNERFNEGWVNVLAAPAAR